MASSKDVEYGGKSSGKGYFLTRNTCILIAITVCVLITVGVLLAYYVPDRSCDPVDDGEDEEIKMPTPTEIPDEKEDFEGRTPDTLVPYHYTVWLQPYIDEELDGEKFMDLDGVTSVYVTCEKATNEIKIHHKFMTINTYEVYEIDDNGNDVEQIEVTDHEIDKKYEMFIITTGSTLEAGKDYRLFFEHVGTVNQTDNRGFYYATYEEDSQNKSYVATQFQAVRARRAFPCFDEPALKATFDTTLVFRPHRIALSNTEIILNETYVDSHTGDTWNVSIFNTTVVMSTYLNAYTIGDWACVEDTTRNGVKFRVWSQPSLVHTAEYGLDIGMEQLSSFEELWGIPYPLGKMDMVALPVFGPGAMENWGLILYREVYLLYDPGNHTPSRKKGVGIVVAHELIHQWFGNWITCGWWSDLWLNEGFATYFEFYGLDMVEKGYDAWNQFFLKDATYRAMATDQQGSSHPIVYDVGFEEEIAFDSITYEKGGSMVMLMEGFLGQDLMFEGFRLYLNRHNYSSVYSDDLWAALDETYEDEMGQSLESSIGYNMKEVMDTWTLQMGFPVVTLTRTATNLVSADQEHYLLDPNDEPQDTHYINLGYVWHVPLTYTHEGEQNVNNPQTVWLHKASAEIELEGATNLHWYVANINQTAFIRVNYDMDNWRKLAKQLQADYKVLPTRNRAHLIDDALHLGQSHHLDHVIAMETIEYLHIEDEHMPWQAFVRAQYYTKYMLWRQSTYGMFEKYIRHLVEPNYIDLGWDFDYYEDVDYYRRLDTLRTACDYNYDDCVRNATSQYAEWMADPNNNPIEINMRQNVYCTSIRHGTDAEWQFAYERQKVDADEQINLQRGMACSRESWTLQRYMEESMVDEGLVTMATIGFVRDASGLGFSLAWDFTLQNFDSLKETYLNAAYDIVWSFASKMNTEKDLKQLNDFGAKYYDMPGTAANGFYKAVETVETNIQWADRNKNDIRTFLEAIVHNLNTV